MDREIEYNINVTCTAQEYLSFKIWQYFRTHNGMNVATRFICKKCGLSNQLKNSFIVVLLPSYKNSILANKYWFNTAKFVTICRDTARYQSSESTSAMPRAVDVIPHQDDIETSRKRSQSMTRFVSSWIRLADSS